MENPYKEILNIKPSQNTIAQESLKTAFINMYSRKIFQNISVKELCQEAGVARTTFYAYYQNTDDLLKEIEDDFIYILFKATVDKKYNDSLDMIDLFLSYLEKNKKLLYAFLVENPDSRFIEKWKTGMKYNLWNNFCIDKNIPNEKLVLEMVSSEIISAYTFWLKYPYEIDFKNIKTIVKQTLKSLEY